jgi:hypothetical protein
LKASHQSKRIKTPQLSPPAVVKDYEAMQPDDHDDLWRLLEGYRQPKVSPFFARNVLREVRTLQQERRSPVFAFLCRWQPLAATACLALLISSGGLALKERRRQAREQQQLLSMAERVYASPDYTVINNLDELIDSEKNSAWLTADLN